MEKQIVKAVQTRLRELGWYTGDIDGDAGALTERAVIDFKAASALNPRAFVGPITLSMLFDDNAKKRPASQASGKPAWLVEAERLDGAHEVRDRSRLMAWLEKGRAALDPAKTPWCGAFVKACFTYSLPNEPMPANPLGARNWLKFGVGLDKPALGAVVVFWRGALTGWQGHVGFVVGEDAKNVIVRGGNQGDQANVRSFAKSRVLGYRWPKGAPLPASAALTAIHAKATTGEA